MEGVVTVEVSPAAVVKVVAVLEAAAKVPGEMVLVTSARVEVTGMTEQLRMSSVPSVGGSVFHSSDTV